MNAISFYHILWRSSHSRSRRRDVAAILFVISVGDIYGIYVYTLLSGYIFRHRRRRAVSTLSLTPQIPAVDLHFFESLRLCAVPGRHFHSPYSENPASARPLSISVLRNGSPPRLYDSLFQYRNSAFVILCSPINRHTFPDLSRAGETRKEGEKEKNSPKQRPRKSEGESNLKVRLASCIC